MRVERQTLLRLPTTGAIVFGIRIHLDPLASLAGDPDGMARLSSALEQLPAEVLEDKALTEIAPAVQEWLAARQDDAADLRRSPP